MNWDSDARSAREESEKSGDGAGKFLKFPNDGAKALVAIIGPPTVKKLVWLDRKSYAIDSAEGQRLIKAGEPIKVRWEIPVLDIGTGAPRVWDCNKQTFKTVDEVAQKYAPDAWCFEIKRRGATGDPKTTYNVLPERKLTEDEMRRIAELSGSKSGDPMIEGGLA